MSKFTFIDIFIVWILVLGGLMTVTESNKVLEWILGLSLASMTGYLCYEVFHAMPDRHFTDEDDDQEPGMFI